MALHIGLPGMGATQPRFNPREPQPLQAGHLFSLQYPDTIAVIAEREVLSDAGNGMLRFCNQQWYAIQPGNIWAPISTAALESAVKTWMRSQHVMKRDGPEPMPTISRTQQEIMKCLQDHCFRAERPAPAPITWAVELLDGRLVVDPTAPDRGRADYLPEDFIVGPLPYTRAKLAGAGEPKRWLAFLRDGFTDNDITLLQEFFGYCLTPNTKHDKFLWIQGFGGSGKTTCISVLEAMLGGLDGVATMDNDSLSNFNADVEGKRLLSFGDYRAGKNDTAMLKLCLQVAGGQTVRIEKKRIDAYSVKTGAKIAVTSNDWFYVLDTSGAIPRRLIPLVRRKGTFKPNVDLLDEMLKEMPGILLWAIEGLKRLNANGFSERCIDGSIMATITTSLDVMIPFIATRLTLDEKARMEKAEFMEIWKAYAREKNIFSHTLDATIHRMIMAAEGHFGATVTTRGHNYIMGARAKTAKEILADKEKER